MFFFFKVNTLIMCAWPVIIYISFTLSKIGHQSYHSVITI